MYLYSISKIKIYLIVHTVSVDLVDFIRYLVVYYDDERARLLDVSDCHEKRIKINKKKNHWKKKVYRKKKIKH